LLLSESSGVGKDYVCKRTLAIFPRESRVHIKKATPEVIAYLHNSEKEPEWTWNGKSLYIEEISSKTMNSETFLAFTSNRDFEGYVLINQEPTKLAINGKPSIFITSASKSPKADTIRRLPSCQLDDSVDQTKAILERQYSSTEPLKYDVNVVNALNHLKIVKVRIPYSQDLGKLIIERFSSNVLLRTTNQRFLDLIKASASLHQYSRTRDKDGYILANLVDYEHAVRGFKKMIASASTISLTRDKQKILEIISDKEHEIISELEPKVTFCNKDTLRKLLRNMADEGALDSTNVERINSREVSYNAVGYKKVELKQLQFPTVEELKANLTEKLDCIDTLKSIDSIESIETNNQTLTKKTPSSPSTQSIHSTHSTVETGFGEREKTKETQDPNENPEVIK